MHKCRAWLGGGGRIIQVRNKGNKKKSYEKLKKPNGKCKLSKYVQDLVKRQLFAVQVLDGGLAGSFKFGIKDKKKSYETLKKLSR